MNTITFYYPDGRVSMTITTAAPMVLCSALTALINQLCGYQGTLTVKGKRHAH